MGVFRLQCVLGRREGRQAGVEAERRLRAPGGALRPWAGPPTPKEDSAQALTLESGSGVLPLGSLRRRSALRVSICAAGNGCSEAAGLPTHPRGRDVCSRLVPVHSVPTDGSPEACAGGVTKVQALEAGCTLAWF